MAKKRRAAKGGAGSKVTIKIPRELYENLRGLIDGTGFRSVTEFVVSVMRDLVAGGPFDEETSLTSREIEMVRKRLRALGYLE